MEPLLTFGLFGVPIATVFLLMTLQIHDYCAWYFKLSFAYGCFVCLLCSVFLFVEQLRVVMHVYFQFPSTVADQLIEGAVQPAYYLLTTMLWLPVVYFITLAEASRRPSTYSVSYSLQLYL